jgi:hypothetical protein
MRFANQESETVSVLIINGRAKRSNVRVELGTITRLPFVNEALRARWII